MYLLLKSIKELTRVGRGFGIVFLIKYVANILLNLDTVLKKKSLGIVDSGILSDVYVTVFGLKFKLLGEMMSTIREVLLKNCYAFDVEKRYATIIDLGANRGVFSVLAAKCSEKVISVECNKEEFSEKFNSVMKMNSVNNAYLINKFAASYFDEMHVSLNQIVQDYCLTEIGFLKIDIEGAESDLFSANLEWLAITNKISVEVHPCFDVDPQKICDILIKSGFSVLCYDLDMHQVPSFTGIGMGYLRANR